MAVFLTEISSRRGGYRVFRMADGQFTEVNTAGNEAGGGGVMGKKPPLG